MQSGISISLHFLAMADFTFIKSKDIGAEAFIIIFNPCLSIWND